jgi:hypothetical protein
MTIGLQPTAEWVAESSEFLWMATRALWASSLGHSFVILFSSFEIRVTDVQKSRTVI